jgi:hypothetical protein
MKLLTQYASGHRWIELSEEEFKLISLLIGFEAHLAPTRMERVPPTCVMQVRARMELAERMHEEFKEMIKSEALPVSHPG